LLALAEMSSNCGAGVCSAVFGNATIVEQLRRLPERGGLEKVDQILDVPVGDHQVEPAVVVGVQKLGTKRDVRPTDVADAVVRSHVAKQTAALIAVQAFDFLTKRGHEQVQIAVVVVVAPSAPMPP
jgi:hypothetical protein